MRRLWQGYIYSNNSVRRNPCLSAIGGHWRGEKASTGSRILTKQLRRRFDDLSDWAMTQLQKANTEQLEAWAEQIFDAPNVETLLGSSLD